MKFETPSKTSQEQPPVKPPVISPKSNKKLFILVGIVATVLLVCIVSFYLLRNRQTNNSGNTHANTSSSASQNSGWKTYTNTYYNFKLDIPKDWKVEEKIIKDKKYVTGETQGYWLSSPNGHLIIDNMSIFGKYGHVKKQLPSTKIQLGTYTLDRSPYIDDDNQRIDYVQLLNVKRQDMVTFAFNGEVEKNNELLLKILKSFAYTKQNPSLDEEISYTIPVGWTKEDTDTSVNLSFTSPDFHEEGIPTIVTGARITVNKAKKNPEKTLAQQTSPDSFYGMWNIATKSATFNSIPFMNIFACAGEFGFCHDYYSADSKGSVWTITMTCNKGCDTKTGIDNTPYAKDRDTFLSSIKFR
jgi:hypothetical protein